MSQWGKPYSTSTDYVTPNGKPFQANKTFIDLYDTKAFAPITENAKVLWTELVDIKIVSTDLANPLTLDEIDKITTHFSK